MPVHSELLSLVWGEPSPIHYLPDNEVLRGHVSERIQKGAPIDIRLNDANGDSMLIAWAYYRSLHQFCLQNQLDINGIYLRNLYGPRAERDRSLGVFHISSIIENLNNPFKVGDSSFFSTYLTKISHAIGVAVQEEDLLKPPLPIPLKNTPFEHFDTSTVEAVRGKTRKSSKGRRIIAITQAGSLCEKRFTDTQIIDLAQFVREVFPSSYVILVSDKAYRIHDVQTLPYVQRYFNAAFAEKDINITMGALAASDVTIATDSFFSWLAASAHAMKSDRNGFLHQDDLHVLHTIGDPRIWGIPGASLTFHPDVQKLAESSEKKGFIRTSQYNDLSNTDGIRTEDLDLFKANIVRSLELSP